jgi:hypothetical protein
LIEIQRWIAAYFPPPDRMNKMALSKQWKVLWWVNNIYWIHAVRSFLEGHGRYLWATLQLSEKPVIVWNLRCWDEKDQRKPVHRVAGRDTMRGDNPDQDDIPSSTECHHARH